MNQMFTNRTIGLFAALFALACSACGESDTTPIVDPPVGQSSAALNLASSNPGGGRAAAYLEAGDSGYRFGPNDRLRIVVFGQDKLSGEYLLAGDGSLAFPLVGRVPANNMTARELEQALTSKLEPEYLTTASVSVEVLTRRPFYVLGEVQKPGSYPHSSRLNVLNAVATAGGYTFRARTSSFYIKRTDETGKLYRVRATAETAVLPGDVVEVNERYF